jgi:hypothetical protein
VSGAERTAAEIEGAERALRGEIERLRGELDAARERASREVAALRQRLDRAEADEERAHERLGDELGRLGDALGPVTTWREDVDRDLGRLTAELAQRAAAIDDANAAIDDLRASDRIVELLKTVDTLRTEQAELLAAADERELRIDAAEGRTAALEAAAEAFSERLHGLEAGAQATAEEARRLREATDRREHDERLGALERRVDALVVASGRRAPGASSAHAGPLTRAGTDRLWAALRGRDAPWPARAWLPAALRSLATTEPATVLRTVAALLPVSARLAGEPLRWELRVDGEGELAAGPEAVPAHFRVEADAVGLAELLDGVRPGRGRVELHGKRRLARRHLAALGQSTRSPANLARAGVWLDPVLLARAIAARVDQDWVGAHRPTVAVSLSGPVVADFAVSTTDGFAVRSSPGGARPDATLAMPTLAFYRWLSGEALDAPVALSGDREAVALVAGWGERSIER